MTCCRSSSIKSSVYNQTGEGYFQQLSAYNHMTAHLRRVHLAKSRIDSKNPSYMQKQRCRYLLNEKLSNKSVSQEFIDRLTYDTQHHPMDILRMDYNFENRCEKYNNSRNRTRKYTTCNATYIECPGSRIHSATIRQLESERSRSISRTRIHGTGHTFHSARPGRIQQKNSWQSRDEVDIDAISTRRGGPISVNSSIRSSPRSNKSKNENDPGCSNYASSFESSSETSRRGSPVPKVLAQSLSPIESSSSAQQKQQQQQQNTDESYIKCNKNDEEAKYSKFLYDITQDIVRHGFYTDEDLKTVFNTHIKKNLHILDKSKMIYELYQLKLSLNIVDQDDAEEEENIEQFIRTQRFSNSSTIKPPTPPKVLDENKLMDKLKNPDELRETYSKSPANGRNTVILIDANPELLITERDILTTLMELNIEPKQVQTVYKRLKKKSRELSNIQLVHPEENKMTNKSSLRRATPEQHKIQSINRGTQQESRSPMNVSSREHDLEKDKLLINRDCPSMVTLKHPSQEKHSTSRQYDYYIINTGKNTRACQYETHVGKTPLRNSSIKSKPSNEVKATQMNNEKKKSKELIDNQFASTSKRIHKRKISSLTQLEGLQSDGTKGMRKNIEVEIKSFNRIPESRIKERPTSHNYDSKNIKMEHVGSSTEAPILMSVNKTRIKEESPVEIASDIENEITEVSDNSSTEFVRKSPGMINDVQEYSSSESEIESIVESLDGAKLNANIALESDIDSDVEQVNNSIQFIHGIYDGNTSKEAQFQQDYISKTIIEFSSCKNFVNSEIQTDTNELSPEISRIIVCNDNNSNDNFEINNTPKCHGNYYHGNNYNNNDRCAVNCPNRKRQMTTNSTDI